MKTPTKKILIVSWVLVVLLILAACTSNPNQPQEQPAEQAPEEEYTVQLPAVGSEMEAENVESEQEVYPAPETDAQPAAYPAPETEAPPQPEADAAQPEAYPAPEEAPASPQPTPRGNDLVATNPGTVELASGQLQLVELFAFW